MFENKDDSKVHTRYYHPKIEIKDYNVVIDGKNFFHQLVKSNMGTYGNIKKIAAGQGDDNTADFLLDYSNYNTVKW